MRKLLTLLFFVFFSLLVGKGVYFLKKGFSPRRIQPINGQIVYGWDEKSQKILNQPFKFIGRGRQCFAFESQDGNYILKFPRTDIYLTPFWMKVLPLHGYREKIEKRHLAQKQFLFNSFQISFHELQDQTTLFAIHLGQTEKTPHLLSVIDALGCLHRLPTYKTSFVLQHKRPLLIPAFLQALQNRDIEKATQILESLIDVIADRAKRGILNRDRSFLRNYGFDGNQAYQIDVGSFFKNPELDLKTAFQKSLRDSTDPVRDWLTQNAPFMLDTFNKKLDLSLN